MLTILPTFGARVALLRSLCASGQERAPSCSEVDRLAGLHRGHVWQIEQGHAENPEAVTVRALARTFGCTVGWLLAGEGAPPSGRRVRLAFSEARARAATPPAPALPHAPTRTQHERPRRPRVVRTPAYDQRVPGEG